MSAPAANRSIPAVPFWRSPWLRPLNDVDAIDDLLAQIRPTWALGRIKARVVDVVRETADVSSFVLQANRNWRGFAAGQHVSVDVEIKGVRHRRSYSLSADPGPGRRIRITVKRQPGGKVSNWMHDALRPGAVLTLGAPQGEFVLPRPAPARILMLSAGSGVTPLMAMLHRLRASGFGGEVAFVHACRTRADAIFGAELERMAAAWPALKLHLHCSAESGRLDLDALAQRVPDYAARDTLMCGPQGFMDRFRRHWREQGLERQLQVENFAPPLSVENAMAARVQCNRAERTFTVSGGAPLLIEAESAGLKPAYGCRIGICHTCVCVKRSGTVENLLTGKVSSEPDERIQLCISRARSDLVLDI